MQTQQPLRLVTPGTAGSQSLMAIAVGRAGILRGGQACAFLVTWAAAERQLGHPLGHPLAADDAGSVSASIREHAEHWGQSERTSWRQHRAWKLAFPGEPTPAALAVQLNALYDLRESKRTDGLLVSYALTAMAPA